MTRPQSLHNKLQTKITLWLVIWVAVSYFINPSSPFLSGHFNDPDDYMRMTQVINWLKGQSWYDLSQPRLSPDDHFVLTWSRIVDIPLAAIMKLFVPVMGYEGAAYMAAFLWPLVLLTLLAHTLVQLTRPYLPKRLLWMPLVLLPCFLPIIREFSPMRVDHHAWQILLAAISLTCLQQAWLTKRTLHAVFAGLAGATALAIGAEGLLNVCLTFLWLGYIALRTPQRGSLVAVVYSLTLATLTAVYLLLLKLPNEWLTYSIQRLSFTQLTITGLAAIGFLVHAMLIQRTTLQQQNLTIRAASLGVIGAGVILSARLLLPELFSGVYAEMSPENIEIILGNVTEAQSLLARLQGMYPSLMGIALYMPLIAQNIAYLIVAVWFGIRSPPRWQSKRGAALLGLYLFFFVCFLLAFGWQSRVTLYAHLYALPLVARGIWLTWKNWSKHYQGRALFAREALLLFCLGPLLVPIIPASIQGKPLFPNMAFYLANREPRACDLKELAKTLNDPKQVGQKPLRILADMSQGAELIFRTPHSVFSAPYDVTGNPYVRDTLGQTDMKKARSMLAAHQVDLVLVCLNFSHIYWRTDDAKNAELESGRLRTEGKPIPPSLMERRQLLGRLLTHDTPPWLERMKLPFGSNFVLYRVK